MKLPVRYNTWVILSCPSPHAAISLNCLKQWIYCNLQTNTNDATVNNLTTNCMLETGGRSSMQTCIKFGTPKWCSDVFESIFWTWQNDDLGNKDITFRAADTSTSYYRFKHTLQNSYVCVLWSCSLGFCPNHKQLFHNHQAFKSIQSSRTLQGWKEYEWWSEPGSQSCCQWIIWEFTVQEGKMACTLSRYFSQIEVKSLKYKQPWTQKSQKVYLFLDCPLSWEVHSNVYRGHKLAAWIREPDQQKCSSCYLQMIHGCQTCQHMWNKTLHILEMLQDVKYSKCMLTVKQKRLVTRA